MARHELKDNETRRIATERSEIEIKRVHSSVSVGSLLATLFPSTWRNSKLKNAQSAEPLSLDARGRGGGGGIKTQRLVRKTAELIIKRQISNGSLDGIDDRTNSQTLESK